MLNQVIIGDGAVGKSSLLEQLVNRTFCGETRATVGVEFSLHQTEVEGEVVRTQIWDTAGQERYRAVTNLYYRWDPAQVG